MNHLSPRLPALDLLRGLAVILMVIFHLIFDLHYFYGFATLDPNHGFFYYLGRLSAIIFILHSGVLTGLRRHEAIPRSCIQFLQKNFKRSLRLLLIASLITLVTYFYDRQNTIIFGILHFLSISIILSSLFGSFPRLNLILGPILISAGLAIKNLRLTNNYLLIFGLPDYNFTSFDYYPLLPWLGVTLIGLSLGHYTYKKKPLLPNIPQNQITKPLQWCGRHSLIIYLIHQPIILLIFSTSTFLFQTASLLSWYTGNLSSNVFF